MPTLSSLIDLLDKRSTAPAVKKLLGSTPIDYRKEAGAAYANLKEQGISFSFKEMGGLFEETVTPDLRVSSIFLNDGTKEGFSAYDGELPGGVEFMDSQEMVISKMGDPAKRGGGAKSSILKKPIPPWMKYFLEYDVQVHFQFNDKNLLTMVTLMQEA